MSTPEATLTIGSEEQLIDVETQQKNVEVADGDRELDDDAPLKPDEFKVFKLLGYATIATNIGYPALLILACIIFVFPTVQDIEWKIAKTVCGMILPFCVTAHSWMTPEAPLTMFFFALLAHTTTAWICWITLKYPPVYAYITCLLISGELTPWWTQQMLSVTPEDVRGALKGGQTPNAKTVLMAYFGVSQEEWAEHPGFLGKAGWLSGTQRGEHMMRAIVSFGAFTSDILVQISYMGFALEAAAPTWVIWLNFTFLVMDFYPATMHVIKPPNWFSFKNLCVINIVGSVCESFELVINLMFTEDMFLRIVSCLTSIGTVAMAAHHVYVRWGKEKAEASSNEGSRSSSFGPRKSNKAKKSVVQMLRDSKRSSESSAPVAQ